MTSLVHPSQFRHAQAPLGRGTQSLLLRRVGATPKLVWACLALLGSAISGVAGTRVEVTADNSIVLVDREWHLNQGRHSQIRIKGNQHLVAMAFDTAPLKGRRIASATLVCHQGSQAIEELTVSTIQAPWDELKSNSLTSGKQPHAGWAWPGARFPAVTGGNSFSLVCQSKSVVKGGVYHWEIAPDLIHANAVGAAHGLTLHEVRCDYSRNPTIYSREQSSRKPHLLVTFGDPPPKPAPPTELKLIHKGDAETLRLVLRAPKHGFAYEIAVNGRPLPRWNIPFVRPGQRQTLPIRDVLLEPGEKLRIAVRTLNRVGQQSVAVALEGTIPKPATLPEPAIPRPPKVVAALKGVHVVPVLDKYDSRGRPVGELPAEHRSSNAVSDGDTIRLAAARGEVVSFQALLTGQKPVTVSCDLPGLRADVFRSLYVESKKGRIPDPLVPCGKLALSPDEATPVVVDVYVPFDFAKREVTGKLSISDGRQIPIHLRVRGFAIPRRASFACEMNGYHYPGTVADFYRLQEIAYDHRCHVNLVPYSHSSAAPGARKCSMSMRMANGRAMDQRRFNGIKPGAKGGWWDEFVEVFGPFLSGSHFKDGHRGPIPAPGFYLPFHESWPLNVRAFWNGDYDAYKGFSHKPEYAATFVSLVHDFVAVAGREGWTKTGFQIYLNNKPGRNDPRRNPWTLDEPVAHWDYRALAYYGDLVRKGRGEPCPVTLRYRIDISRPQFDRGQLLGKRDFWVVSSAAFRTYPRLVADRSERTGERFWVYGSSNPVEASNRTIQAWALEVYGDGGWGVLPWQTINKDGSALKKADQLGLFIFDKASGKVHHSMRLKAYRRAEQDIEYLELLRKRLKLSPAQLRAFIDRYVPLGGTVDQSHPEDAGTPRYGKLSPESFRRLREAAAALIESAR